MRFPSLDEDLVDRYLPHLQIPPPSTPSPDGLRLLHRAHLHHVPYENIEIQLGRPTSIDPAESVRRILTGRGGYCYHLNGSFGALLSSLGYDVVPVRAAIRTSAGRRPWGSHLVVLVRFPQGLWLADVGLGDGFHDPVPLAAGMVDQPPFSYRLEHLAGPAWRFHHDRRSPIAGFDLDVRPVPLGEFRPMHEPGNPVGLVAGPLGPADDVTAEHEGDHAAKHVLVDAGEYVGFDAQTRLLLDLPA